MEVKLSIEENQFEFFMNLIEKLQGVVKNYEILEKDNLNTPNKETIKAINEAKNREGVTISLDEMIKSSKEKVI